MVTEKDVQEGVQLLTDPEMQQRFMEEAVKAPPEKQLKIADEMIESARWLATFAGSLSSFVLYAIAPYIEALQQSADRIRSAALRGDKEAYLLEMKSFLEYSKRVFEFGMSNS